MVYFNDRSLHGQFTSHDEFCESLRCFWEIKASFQNAGHPIRVIRTLRQRPVTHVSTLDEHLGKLERDARQRLLLWLDRNGPFWEDGERHGADVYLECDGEQIVTDSGLGEAAFAALVRDEPNVTASLAPSHFCYSPINITWRQLPDSSDATMPVENVWETSGCPAVLEKLETEPTSWDDLIAWAGFACPHLVLSPEIPSILGSQFIPNVANRAKVLLKALNAMAGAQQAGDSASHHQLIALWMHGDRARFSDSSDSEKHEFRCAMTFVHCDTGEPVFCPMHGKIQTPQFRIHFEWPLPESADRLFVAYIGPKITKR